VVDELGATGEKVWPSIGPHLWWRAGGEMRHRPALPGREIEDEDLHGLLAAGPRPEIREGDPTAVRAEEDRRGEDPSFPGGLRAVDEILREAEALVAARGTQATQSVAVGVDEEDPFLFRGQSRRCHDRELIVHLEHDTRPVRAHPEALQRQVNHR